MNPFIENNERCHFPNFQEVFKVVEKGNSDFFGSIESW